MGVLSGQLGKWHKAPPTPPESVLSLQSNESGTTHLSTSDRMERVFYLNLIRLVNEVQGDQTLQSQVSYKQKSSWVKQIKNPKAKKDALTILN